MRFDFRLIGADRVERRIPAAWQRFSDAAGKTLEQEARATLTLARVLAPVRTGALRRSGYVRAVPLVRGRGHAYVVGFGGSKAPYAMIVHETHPTRAKFLEQAYRMLATGLKARLEAGIRRQVR
jgi:hypothetical protein